MSTPAWKGKLSILLLDSSDSMIDHYRHKIVDLFKAVGYAPMVTAVVSGPKGDVEVTITDKLPSGSAKDLDLSPAAFDQIADQAAGRVPITWSIIG